MAASDLNSHINHADAKKQEIHAMDGGWFEFCGYSEICKNALLKSSHVPDPSNVQLSPDKEGIELRTFQPEQKEGTTSSRELKSCDITILGLQELLNNHWLEIDGLILISFLSVRARQIASNGRYWRAAIRATFPMHPFEERDRKVCGMSYFQSRSARIGIRKSLSAQSTANACRKDFLVCLERDHAVNLFEYAFTKEITEQNKDPHACLRFQTLRAGENRNAQLERVKLMTDLTKEGMTFGVVDLCVTVNLCKPEQYSTHMIEIYNGDTRAHSNLPDDADPRVSCVQDKPDDGNDGDDLDAWCPYYSRHRHDLHFVEICNLSCARKLCIEGVAVVTSGPIAVRVELKRSTDNIDDTAGEQSEGEEAVLEGEEAVLEGERTVHISIGEEEEGLEDVERAGGTENNGATSEAKREHGEVKPEGSEANSESKSEDDVQWIAVADGTLLRPSKVAHVHFKRGGEKIPVQLILFPDAYASFPLDRARITVAECDGGPVQVALLTSRTFNGSGARVESVFTDRTVNFEGENDYRNWWFRLQEVRRHACRVMPVVREAQENLSGPVSAFIEADQCVRNPHLKMGCAWDDEDCSACAWDCTKAVHTIFLLFLFPSFFLFMMGQITLSPDEKANIAKNKIAITPYHLIVHPNNDTLVRTNCWPTNVSAPAGKLNRKTKQIEYTVIFHHVWPLTYLFLPILIACVYSLMDLLARSFVVFNVCRRTCRVAARFRRAKQHLTAVYEYVKARKEAVLAPLKVNSDRVVTSTIEDLVDCSTSTLDFFANNQMQLPRFFHWPPWRHEKGMVTDIFVLFLGGYAAVGYVLLDRCRFGEQGSKVVTALPIAFVALSVVADATLITYLVALNLRWKHVYKRPRTCFGRSLYIMATILAQQALLLLKMFTFFREVSFVVVFSPAMVLTIILVLDVFIYNLRKGTIVFFQSLGQGYMVIFFILSMALKVDQLYGIPTEVNLNVSHFVGQPFKLAFQFFERDFDWVCLFVATVIASWVVGYACLILDRIVMCVCGLD